MWGERSTFSWAVFLALTFAGCGMDHSLGSVSQSQSGKIEICHVPPGNPANAHVIVVSARAVPAHLAHGDWLGPCEVADLVEVTGLVRDGSGAPLAGAVVWVPDGDPSYSTTSDDAGVYSLMLPVGATVFIRAEKDGFMTAQRGIVVPESGTDVWIGLIARETVEAVMAQLGVELDPTKGTVVFSFLGSTEEGGFGADLSQAHDLTIGLGPEGPVESNVTLPGSRELIFGGVSTGSTTVELYPRDGHTCALQEAIGQYRVDPDVFTSVLVDCAQL